MNIRELAQLAGVSKTTAAYALKNSSRVSLATCQRIQRLANEHGYTANPTVNSFMREVRKGKISKYQHTIGFISSLDPDNTPRRLRHSNELELIQGAQAEAKTLGCDLDIIDWSLNVADQVRLSQIIEARGIRGIFLGPAVSPHTKMELNWDRIAAISSGFTVEEPPMDRTAADLFTSIIDAGQRALDRNYQRVIIAMNDFSNERVGWRWLAAASTLREIYGSDRVQILRGNVSDLVGEVVEIKAQAGTLALLGHSDLYGQLTERGFSFPQDMGFVAFDTIKEKPTVSAIVQPHFESGRRGLRYLYNAVENGVFGIPKHPCRLAVRCLWHEGNTLPHQP